MNKMWVFDPDVLSAGVASGIEALRSASGSLERLRTDSGDDAAMRDLDASMHRVSCVAANVGLADICGSVGEVELTIERFLRESRPPSQDELLLLGEAVSTLRGLFLSIDGRTGSIARSEHSDDRGRLRDDLTVGDAKPKPSATLRARVPSPPASTPL